MRNSRKLFFVAVLSGCAAVAACGDDDNLVRTRPDGGTDASLDGNVEGGSGDLLSCGLPIPATYVSPNFATNAKEELDLKARVLAIGEKMKSAEGPTPQSVSAADLNGLFTAGVPSLRSVATAFTQSTVDTYIAKFVEGSTKTWTPADAEGDGGAATGGKYDNASIVSAVGIDFREASEKLLINGSLYSDALLLASGAVTEATVDRLLALFGASTMLANRTDDDAGELGDALIAEYASKRDNKRPEALGPYRKVARALKVAKAAAAGGAACKADLDGALKIFFLEWEKTSYLTVIYYLNQTATYAIATPQKGQLALHAYGEALGFVQSFKGIPQDRRRITDVQIDALLVRIGADKPYQYVTHPERVLAFDAAYTDIGTIYALSPTELEDAKKAY